MLTNNYGTVVGLINSTAKSDYIIDTYAGYIRHVNLDGKLVTLRDQDAHDLVKCQYPAAFATAVKFYFKQDTLVALTCIRRLPYSLLTKIVPFSE